MSLLKKAIEPGRNIRTLPDGRVQYRVYDDGITTNGVFFSLVVPAGAGDEEHTAAWTEVAAAVKRLAEFSEFSDGANGAVEPGV